MTTLFSARSRPLRMMVLVSATGGNLRTACDFARAHPDLLNVVLVASDRTRAGALDIARDQGIETWAGEFERECGRFSNCRTEADRQQYWQRSREFHDRLSARVASFEAVQGPIDIVLLAYHRWIHGDFLARFANRIINQHPGDLASVDAMGERDLIGLDPVGDALRRGDKATRTSTFLVDDSHDGGTILAQGPWVDYAGERPPSPEAVMAHENRQKEASDRPALTWVLSALCQGRLGIGTSRHVDGSATALLDGSPLPLGGHSLEGNES